MDDTTRRMLIAKYKDGFRVVVESLENVTEPELDARPALDEWTVREIVHHLADSEMTSAIRLRRLLAEQQPIIHGYDENEFARRLYYDRPIAASLDAFRAAREVTAEILERMTKAEWEHVGTHTESGEYSAERWLEIYAAHAHDHAAQIRRARAAYASGGK